MRDRGYQYMESAWTGIKPEVKEDDIRIGMATEEVGNKIENGADQTPLNSQSHHNDVTTLTESESNNDINDTYCRMRCYGNIGKYRIGPINITQDILLSISTNQPGRLQLTKYENMPSMALLKYLQVFTEQPEKSKIDLEFIKILLEFGIDINERDELGQTALHAIVRDWNSDVCRFVLEHNANANVQDNYGRSPLHLAAALNFADTIKVLIKYGGANPNLETFGEMQTPVHYASKYDAIDALKTLLLYGGSITPRDYNDRTPLFVAAEKGSKKTSQFLIDMGAPSGTFDRNGNSALAVLVEKIPHNALQALQQYCQQIPNTKQCEVYLSSLEFDISGLKDNKMFAKTPLDLITLYHDRDLIMHPVIQTTIAVKWEQFGRINAITNLALALINVVCWLVLSYWLSDYNDFYHINSDNWKILFQVLVVIFALYFFVKNLILIKHSAKFHQEWVKWKAKEVRSHYVYCHPAWPSEREGVANEEERIRSAPNLAEKQIFWFLYECFNMFVLSMVIITRVLAMVYDESNISLIIHKIIIGISIFCAFTRLIKVSMQFRSSSIFLKVAASAITSVFQIAFLYFQFYIPFAAAFWLWFGIPEVTEEYGEHRHQHFDDNQELTAHQLSLHSLLYNLYVLSFEDETLLKLERIDYEAADSLLSLYHCLTTAIALWIIVAFITGKYATNIKICIAEASLYQAHVLLQLERNLSESEKHNLEHYYIKQCTPLLVDDPLLSKKLLIDNARHKVDSLLSQITKIFSHVKKLEAGYIDTVRTANLDQVGSRHVYKGIISRTKAFNHDLTICKLHRTINDLTKLGANNEYLNKILPRLLKPSPAVLLNTRRPRRPSNTVST